MFHSFSVEAIGHSDARQMMSLDRSARCGKLLPWVAEIIGLDARFGLKRRFLRPAVGYEQSNSVGSRGVRYHYLLREGSIYHAHFRVSWRNSRTYYFRMDPGGVERPITEEEVRSAATNMTEPEPIAAPAHVARLQTPAKTPLGKNVLDAARERIAWIFDTFPKVYVSFSGGKDSTVMLHLVAEEARRKNRPFGLLFIDLEAQYGLTIQHIQTCFDRYRDIAQPYWIALPLSLRNAVSQFEPRWICWEAGKESAWVRSKPEDCIAEPGPFPFFRYGMEFEEFVEEFGHWYGEGQLTCCLVGIRADESLNRFRTLVMQKTCLDSVRWTTWKSRSVYNAYPIYDWRTADIWTYHAVYPELPHNALYDRMHQAGLTIHQMRICQPYGDDQRKGLWLYQIIEPETWGRVVARVNGANSGALYAQESGNILGRLKISKPATHTWQSFAELLLDSMPPKSSEHYRNKIAVFLHWWEERGYPNGIPDEADTKEEAAKKLPSWRRICKAILRHDYWFKGLSFTQTKSAAYEKYMKVMKARRQRWGIFA